LPLTRFRGALFRPLRHATAGETIKLLRMRESESSQAS
jgi:hypothetical protein